MMEVIYCDFLVIGTGVAGLSAVLEIADKGKVVLISKSDLKDCATAEAQGGVSAALGAKDNPELHKQDTLNAGAELCNLEAVDILTKEAPKIVGELIRMGASFDTKNKKLDLLREAAHSRNRIVHAKGDATGLEIENVLLKNLQKDSVSTLEHHFVLDLIVEDDTCMGAWVYDLKNDRVKVFLAHATLLATGGVGQLFLRTTNPKIATGDGMSMAYRVGACLRDMEFVQFHPTALYIEKEQESAFLLSEVLRGEGAVLFNTQDEAFMSNYHPEGELASRDIVTRSIFQEMHRTKSPYVYLDIKPVENFKKRFPKISKMCEKMGVDLSSKKIPVSPAAHYIMGGIQVNLWGETAISGLFAAGETACLGLHGANRLASNSLIEGLIFGKRMGQKAKEYILKASRLDNFKPPSLMSSLEKIELNEVNWKITKNKLSKEMVKILNFKKSMQEIMWDKVGIARHHDGLTEAINKLDQIQTSLERIQNKTFSYKKLEPKLKESAEFLIYPKHPLQVFFELKNMLFLARLISEASRARTESRGAHYRSDFPRRNDPRWHEHLDFQKLSFLKIY
ncbi:MAG: L-aspartate oxidase [Armatimonadetes bacterium]|nr:L-aspartate oxidase [Armatimonadota bacterium]